MLGQKYRRKTRGKLWAKLGEPGRGYTGLADRSGMFKEFAKRWVGEQAEQRQNKQEKR